MKKVTVIIAALCAALAFVSCVSTPPASDMMASAKRNTPNGSLVGQATGSSAQQANANAKVQLARAIDFMVADMVDKAVASNKLASAAGQELKKGVSTALGRSNLAAAVKQDEGVGSGKVYWAVYYMDKSEVIKTINQVVALGKQTYPSAAAFTVDGIDAVYATFSAREWKN